MVNEFKLPIPIQKTIYFSSSIATQVFVRCGWDGVGCAYVENEAKSRKTSCIPMNCYQ